MRFEKVAARPPFFVLKNSATAVQPIDYFCIFVLEWEYIRSNILIRSVMLVL